MILVSETICGDRVLFSNFLLSCLMFDKRDLLLSRAYMLILLLIKLLVSILELCNFSGLRLIFGLLIKLKIFSLINS